ncbi:PepSY-associated TM helix family [Nitrosococcus oceani AFC27]|nr:PepSY-associated TM helix family [Nitrosococcus oceani AFC27]KFI20803.1 peptidase [Nitrosococcus oceani C-27]
MFRLPVAGRGVFTLHGERQKLSLNQKRIFIMANLLKVTTSRFRWHSLWRKVHLYLALTVGFFFVLLGLTGSVNVFHWELEELSLPALETRESPKAGLPLNAVMANLHQAHPQRQGRWLLFMPGYEREYVWAIYPHPEETRDVFFAPLRVQLDPGSGKLVAEHFWGETLGTLIYSLHASLLTGIIWDRDMGLIGFQTVTFLGLFLLISAAIGLYLWWPRTGTFLKAMRFQRQGRVTRTHFELHRLVGFYGSVILLVLAFTGFSFGYYDYLKPLVAAFSPVEAKHFKDPEGLKSTPVPGTQPITIEQAVAIANQVFPNAELRWLATPEGPEGVYAIEKRQPGEANQRRPRSKVWVEQYSGEVLAVEDPNKFTAGETFFNLMWPLHNGQAFGFPGRLLWCLVGFVPLTLYITGLTLWLRKRRVRRLARHKGMAATVGGLWL